MSSILTRDEFLSGYWAQYLLLEKEFMETIPFVSLASENGKTFSDVYLKLILGICSETEVALRMYCNMIDQNFDISEKKHYTIVEYKTKADLPNDKMQFVDNKYKSLAFEVWGGKENNKAPDWWKTYNKIKHQRMDKGKIPENGTVEQEFYKFANQKHVLSALGGLYQVLSFAYKHIADEMKQENPENDFMPYPTPQSKLFKPIFELTKKR